MVQQRSVRRPHRDVPGRFDTGGVRLRRIGAAAAAMAFVAFGSGPAAAQQPAAGAHMPTSGLRTLTPPGGKLTRLHVETMGEGEPIILLHGLGGSTYTWRRIAPALARTHRVIAIDLKGFGLSEKPEDDDYALADHASLIAAYIESEGLTNVTLAGHSFGGMVALAATLDLNARKPLTVGRLVLIDTPAYPQEPSVLMQLVQQPLLPYALLAMLPPEVATSLALARQIDARTISDDDVKAYAAPYHDAAAQHALISTARQLLPTNWPEVIAAYRSIRQPTLLVWCDRDEVVPAVTGLKLERAMPNATLRIVEGCEHSPADEAAPVLLAHMKRFLAPGKQSALGGK